MIAKKCKTTNPKFMGCPAVWLMCLLLLVHPETGQAAKLPGLPTASPVQEQSSSAAKDVPPAVPVDEYNRGAPRSSIKGFLSSVDKGEYETAVEFLDLRNLPKGMSEDGPRLARMLKIILDRALWIDMDLVSENPNGNLDDGLPSYRDFLGQITAGDRAIDILMQRVPRSDGVRIWKISNKTTSRIPLLYEYHGYSRLEEYLEGIFPGIQFLGWQAWQWASFVTLVILSYLVVWIPTKIAGHLFIKRNVLFGNQLAGYFYGPVRLSIWIILAHWSLLLLAPSESIRGVTNAATLMYLIITWTIIRFVDLGGLWFAETLKNKERNAALVLLKPISTVLKVIIILVGFLLWLDNIGIHVGALLASLGIGGFALALACQDMLKNLLGSIVILIDKPYEIGQRIVAKGHDGVVEEIGLRSTRVRLLTGHQAIIPNEDMAKIDIENIGRRPHIRRRFDLAIALGTPASKIERAINIIKECLDSHECMDPDYPPRVFFDKVNRDSINIRATLWYRSTDYWAFQAFNEKLNLRIISKFEAEGIKFALPSFSAFGQGVGQDPQSHNPLSTAQQQQV